MEVMSINGHDYLVNTALEPHVLDSIVDDILKHYPIDAEVEFREVTINDLI